MSATLNSTAAGVPLTPAGATARGVPSTRKNVTPIATTIPASAAQQAAYRARTAARPTTASTTHSPAAMTAPSHVEWTSTHPTRSAAGRNNTLARTGEH